MNSGGLERVERPLAAAPAADVAGYSRLMGADEKGTLAALKAIRQGMDPRLLEPTTAGDRASYPTEPA